MVHVGFEVGTGLPVGVPLHHMVVTGLTRLSGKTTTVEAILSRLPEGISSLVFRTKRGEVSFQGCHAVQPFYRQQTDWEYVEALLEAAMKERMRLERSFIIKATKGTTSLRQVYQNIVKMRREARRGFDEAVYTNLQAYFEKVLPQLEEHAFSAHLELALGPNVMDLGHLSEEVQALVISACLEEVWKVGINTVLVIPEAWAFVPQSRGNPVKWAAQHVIRQGGATGVYLVLDSQDVTGISKDVLKSVGVWLLGRQQEINEVRRVLDQIPTKVKPRPEDIMTLPLGHFFVAAEDWCRKVYVQPAWLDDATARGVSTGEIPVRSIIAPIQPEEDPMLIAELQAKVKELEQKAELLTEVVSKLNDQLSKAEDDLMKERARLKERGEEADNAAQLRQALVAFLGDKQLPPSLATNHQELVGYVVEEVQKRLNLRGEIQLAPPQGVLKERYQQLAVSRLTRIIGELSAESKNLLCFLAAVGKASRTELAIKVAGEAEKSFIGQKIARWHQMYITPLANFKLVSWQPKTSEVFYTLREAVRRDLEVFGPSEEEITAVVDHLEHTLAEKP